MKITERPRETAGILRYGGPSGEHTAGILIWRHKAGINLERGIYNIYMRGGGGAAAVRLMLRGKRLMRWVIKG